MKVFLNLLLFCFFLFFLSPVWALPICQNSPGTEGDSTPFWNNCFGTYTFSNGDKYEGSWKNDLKHGQGLSTYNSGDAYLGEFKNNTKHGYGNYFYASGDKYTGQFKNDDINGMGINALSNGDKYIGEFLEENYHGSGIYIFSDGSLWLGTFDKGNWSNGRKYTSEEYDFSGRANENIHGILPECIGSPAKQGENIPHWTNCLGTHTWLSGDFDGDKYIGDWKNDQMHGNGIYIYADGQTYTGEFLNGLGGGFGMHTWPSKDKYLGQYKEDNRSGLGIYFYSNGDRYIGEWIEGNKDGEGTYFYRDGRVHEGLWKDGSWIDGIKYAEGEYNLQRMTDDYENVEQSDDQNQAINSNEVIPAASGTGFSVSNSGHIVTNNHVVDGCDDVTVHQKGEVYEAIIVEKDIINDLALIKADFSPPTIFAISDDNAQLMQDIFVAGYPFGAAISSSVKVTKGIVSSLSGIGNNYSNMQIDASLQPGNSGGPILDQNGNVVGVAVAKLDLAVVMEEFGVVPENTNFGIKSSILKNFLESNGILIKEPSKVEVSRSELGKKIIDGTLFLSCWMTYAKIQKLKTEKVMFENLY